MYGRRDFLIDKNSNMLHLKDSLWLKRIGEQKKGQMQMVNICIRMKDDTFVSIGVVYLYEGIYYDSKNNPIGTIDDVDFPENIERVAGISKTKNRSGKSASGESVSIEEICEEYKQTNSIRKAAKKAGLSEEKTKKIHIEKGVFTSEKYEKIKVLLEQGKNIDEIAAELKMSQKQLRVFIPN
jgi:hypothetical protein